MKKAAIFAGVLVAVGAGSILALRKYVRGIGESPPEALVPLLYLWGKALLFFESNVFVYGVFLLGVVLATDLVVTGFSAKTTLKKHKRLSLASAMLVLSLFVILDLKT